MVCADSAKLPSAVKVGGCPTNLKCRSTKPLTKLSHEPCEAVLRTDGLHTGRFCAAHQIGSRTMGGDRQGIRLQADGLESARKV